MSSTKRSPDGSNTRVQELILWARKNGVALTKITVGDTTLELHDVRLSSGQHMLRAAIRKSIYEEFGGDVLDDKPRDGRIEVMEPIIIEDDDGM